MDRMKISSKQVFWLISSMEIGMSVLLTISPVIREAKQDAWLSIIIATGACLLMTFIAVKLSLLYPKQTLIQFSQLILGKWLGKVIVIPYFIMWYSVIGIILRQSSDFIHLVLFRRTPLWVIILLALILIIYSTYAGGIEGIGRSSELLGPFIFVALIIVLILGFKTIHFDRILPVYQDTGFITIFKGAITPLSFLGESVMMTMLVGFMSKPKKALSSSIWGVLISGTFLIIATIFVILIFGNLGSRMWYPFFDMARYLSFMEFIQNIDAVIVVVWLCSVFIKLSLYMFFASYGTAQWLGVKDWRKLIWVVSFIGFVLALIPANVDVSSSDFPSKFWIPFILPINMIGIPIFLLSIGLIRKKLFS